MFENLVNQEVTKELKSDIKKNLMPSALLYAGSHSSGKLTAALETTRILSCKGEKKGHWQCECTSCLQNKSLISSNLLLLGPRDCSLEILASKKTFLEAISQNAPYLDATRYLFLRSIRKLTLRFNPILQKGEKDINKIATILESINENLELLDFPRSLPPREELEKITISLEKNCKKLENEYLYDSIPVNQIRNMEEWAHIKTEDGKKTIIIENADRMQASVRNALLKILEEPPTDCVFILLSSKRNAIMQTILSRVRTYNFRDRTLEKQQDIIQRVFHNQTFYGSINEYLLTFLPITPKEINEQAQIFYRSIVARSIPDIAGLTKKCENFTPRIELKLFLNDIAECVKPLMKTQKGAEVCAKVVELLRNCQDNITMYNQTPTSALECLLRDMAMLNQQNGGIFV